MIDTEHYSHLALHKLIDALACHIYIKDLEGRYLLCNQRQAASLDLEVKDVLGKTDYDIYWKTPQAAQEYRKNDLYVMQSGCSLSKEEPGIVDGKRTIVLSKKTPLRDEQGVIVGILGISIDLATQKKSEKLQLESATAQYKQLEQAKEKTEATLRYIINLMPGHVYWKDLNFRYLGCNKVQATSAGLDSPKDIIGKTDDEMPWRSQAKMIRQIDEQVLRTQEEISIEEAANLSNGGKAIFFSKKVPLKDDNGNITGILGISFDITDQKEAEKLRLQNTIVAQKAKTSSMLAAGIAHELRTPLAAIDLLGGQVGDIMGRLIEGYTLAVHHGLISEPLSQKSLRIAAQVGSRLLQIVRSAHTFIDMMLMKVNFQKPKKSLLSKLSICSAVEQALQAYPLGESDAALVHWDRELNQQQDFIFMGEQTLFNHALFNLLKNALYYIKSAHQGEIKIWLERNSKENLLHFMDTGEGIAADILPHIFDAFYTQSPHGTGVGLALCKIIMHEFNGDISCQSIQGKYTQFTLHFPPLKKESSL